MLDAFIKLAEAAGKIGKVTAASMYASGLICIDVLSEDGKCFYLTFSDRQYTEGENDNP